MSSSDTEQLLDPAYVEDAAVAAQAEAGEQVESGGLARKLARWVTKGGLAILDQGLISGSNFLIGILLARWLVPAEYGAFSLAFSVFLLLSYVYHSLLSEPQGVFSGSAYRHCLRGYLKALLGIQAVLTVFGLVLLGGSAAVVYGSGESRWLAGSAGWRCDRVPVHLVLLVAAARILHEPGARTRCDWRFHLLRAGDRWVVRGIQAGAGLPVLGVPADGDRRPGHRILPAVAGE